MLVKTDGVRDRRPSGHTTAGRFRTVEMTAGSGGQDIAALRQLIAGGETGSVEFKSSFKFDRESRTANKVLPRVVAKTMSGFLNASGGTLLLGIADDGAPLGLAADMELTSSRSADGLERAVRTAIANYLGVEVSPHINLEFIELDGYVIARLRCAKYHEPVFLRDGDKQLFYVRDGNQTKPLDVASAHAYISGHWHPTAVLDEDRLRAIVAAAVVSATPASAPQTPMEPSPTSVVPLDPAPPWLRVASHRVLQLFLDPLAKSHGWKRLYIVSPWLSSFDSGASITFTQMLKRIVDDGTTVYVVTRPPESAWHSEAVELLASTTRANIVEVPQLHAKLYAARTATASFAVLGSANFTQASLAANREIAVRVDGYAGGRSVVSNLELEAANIYRTPGRHFLSHAKF
jgi:Putative DNA-binding domain/PLD-like domain